MMQLNEGAIEPQKSTEELPIEIIKGLFPLRNMSKWERAPVLTLCEALLLHYNIEPVSILSKEFIPRVSEPTLEAVAKLIEMHWAGSAYGIILDIDSNSLVDLFGRALLAGDLIPCSSGSSGFYDSAFYTQDIVKWMQKQAFTFPLSDSSEVLIESDEMEVEGPLLNCDLFCLKPSQRSKLFARLLAVNVRKKEPTCKIVDIVRNKEFVDAVNKYAISTGMKEKPVEQTLNRWVSDVRPNSKPRKNNP